MAFTVPDSDSTTSETTIYAKMEVREGEKIQNLTLYEDSGLETSLSADGDVAYGVSASETGEFTVSAGDVTYTVDYDSISGAGSKSSVAAHYTILSTQTLDLTDTSTKLTSANATGYYVKAGEYVLATNRSDGKIANVYSASDLTTALVSGTDYIVNSDDSVTIIKDTTKIRTYALSNTTNAAGYYLPSALTVTNEGASFATTTDDLTYGGRDASEQLITATVGDYEVTLSADASAISYVSSGTYSSATSLAADGLSFTDSSTGLKYTLTYDNGADGSIGGGDDSITATGEAYTVAASSKLSSVSAQDYIPTALRTTVAAGESSYIVTVDSATSIATAYMSDDTLLANEISVNGYTFEWYDANANGSVDAGDDVLVRTAGADSITATNSVTITGSVSDESGDTNIELQFVDGKVVTAPEGYTIAADGQSITDGAATYVYNSETSTFTLNGTTSAAAASDALTTTWSRTITYSDATTGTTFNLILTSDAGGTFALTDVTDADGNSVWNSETNTATVNGQSFTVRYLSTNQYTVASSASNSAINGTVDSNLVEAYSFEINGTTYKVGLGDNDTVYYLDENNALTDQVASEITIDTVVTLNIATANNVLTVSEGETVLQTVAADVVVNWTFSVGGETFTLVSGEDGYTVDGQDIGEDGLYALTTASGTYNVSVSGTDTPTVVQTGSVGASTTYTVSEGEEGAPSLTMANADGTTSEVTLTAVTETDEDTSETTVTGYRFAFNGANYILSGNAEDGYEVAPEDEDSEEEITVDGTTFTLTTGATEDTTVAIEVEPAGTYIVSGGETVATVGSDGTFSIGDEAYTLSGSASAGYSLVNGDGAVSVSGSTFNVETATTAAERNSDGSWTIASDTAITNASEEPIVIAGAASGTLGAGDVYDAATGTLTDNGTQGDSTIRDDNNHKLFAGGHTITGTTSDTTMTPTEDGGYDVSGLNGESTFDGKSAAVLGDDNFGGHIDSDGNVTSLFDVSDGASLTSAASGKEIITDSDATISVPNGTYEINGDELTVAGDADGVKVATNPEAGITGVSDVDDGASITAEAGTPISVDTNNDKEAEVAINGQTIAVSGDADGITVTPGEDGTAATVSGLDEGAVLGGDGSVSAGGQVYALDGESSVKGGADGAANIWTADMDAIDKAAQDIINSLDDATSFDTVSGAASVNAAIAEATDSTITATLGGGAGWDGDMAVTVGGGEGQDVDLDFSQNTGRKLVNLTGQADNNVTFNDEGGNYAILSPGARGSKDIKAGDGGDNLMNYSKRAKVTMTGGAGDDNIRMSGGANEMVDVSGGGEDTLDAPNGGRVTGYNPRTRAKFKSPFAAMSNLINALKGMFTSRGFEEERGYAEDAALEKGVAEDGSDLSFGAGTFNMGSSGDVSLNGYDSTNGTFVNMINGDGSEALMGWGDMINGASYGSLSSELLLGNGAQGLSNGSTMMGGTKADTMVAGRNDVVYLSGGADDIELVESEGAVVAIGDGTNDGETTLNGAVYGHDEDTDVVIRLDDRSKLKVGFSGSSAIMNVDKTSLVLNSALSTKGTSSESGYSSGADENSTGVDVLLQNANDSTTYRARLIAGGTAAIADQYEKATEFYGVDKELTDSKQANGTGVNFADYTEKLFVNMGDTVTAGNYHFFNIDSVTGGAGLTTLIGNDENNALIAGDGETTVWGAAGRDSLFGTGNSSQSGATTFVYQEGDGMDTISSFNFGMTDNSDKLSTNGQAISDWTLEDGKLKIQAGADYDDQVTINDADQKAIKMNLWGSDFNVEVGTSAFTYREGVDFYLTKESAATLNASSSADDELEIYVNGFDGKAYDNVTAINASSAAGKTTLVGGGKDEMITGGSGSNSLWGGESGNDTMYGGSGSNEFFYLNGNGNDVINNANSNDVVNLFGINIDDIDLEKTSIDSSSITVAMKDGGSLTVNSSNDVTFKVADGSEWHAVNRSGSNATWTRRTTTSV